MNGPLSGVFVVDFTRVMAGPHATLTMADMGAEVVKIEPPAGDVTRFQTPRRNGIASYFAQQNIGKQCISVDLSTPDGVALALDLCDRADVVIENYRAGVMDRLGLGYETVAARNPTVVYCSISGYGQTGPWRDRRAYAPVVGAEAGLTKSQGDQRGGEYRNDRHSHADAYTALEAVSAICAALYARERTGTGDYIDVSMAETLLYVNEHVQNDLWDAEEDPSWIRSFGNEDHPVVQVANGDNVVIASNPALKGAFEIFVAAMDRPDLIDDPRFATQGDRKRNLDDLIQIVTEFAAQQPDVESLEAAFDKHPSAAGSLAVGKLRSVRELADSEWAAERAAIRTVNDRGDGVLRLPNVPWHFTNHPDVGTRAEPPRFRGEDNTAVLSTVLGLTDDTIEDLAARGVISDHLPRDK